MPASGENARRYRTLRSSATSSTRFADAVESGDVDATVALLTDDAWLTMPPLPHAYQGHEAISAFLRGAEERRGAPMRLVATRANTQPAFGCYLTVPGAEVAHAFSVLVLTLDGDRVSAITWFADRGVFVQFGCPTRSRTGSDTITRPTPPESIVAPVDASQGAAVRGPADVRTGADA